MCVCYGVCLFCGVFVAVAVVAASIDVVCWSARFFFFFFFCFSFMLLLLLLLVVVVGCCFRSLFVFR